jgi:hypothetical protein
MQTVHEVTQERAIRVVPPYRNLVLSFGAQLALTMVSMAGSGIPSDTGREAIGVLLSVFGLCTVAALVYYGYRTSEALGSRAAWAWAAGMLLPCVNVVTLLVLSSRATRLCRAAGIPVGLFGPQLPTNSGGGSDGAA